MRQSKITYYPSLSVMENAKKNGVSEAAVRYYIKSNHIDRRAEEKARIIADCRKYYAYHPQSVQEQNGDRHQVWAIHDTEVLGLYHYR